MFKKQLSRSTLELHISPAQENLGLSIFALEEFLKEKLLRDEAISRAMVILRELLDNAIRHGRGHKPSEPIEIKVKSHEQNRFSIMVKDSGNGFNYQQIDYHLPAHPRQKRRRGYHLIAEHADRIAFNDEGSRVTVYTTLEAETTT